PTPFHLSAVGPSNFLLIRSAMALAGQNFFSHPAAWSQRFSASASSAVTFPSAMISLHVFASVISRSGASLVSFGGVSGASRMYLLMGKFGTVTIVLQFGHGALMPLCE